MKQKMLTPTLIITLALVLLGGLIFSACKGKVRGKTGTESEVVHLDWAKDALIYEVNVRQFTPEGTFKAFEAHLPRLKELGVDILWLMPIHPIGEKNRKGPLGSYYSVRDYTAVNPEFGDMQDFKDLVAKAHELEMYVILDWVANHTAWDHDWIEAHPDWYTRDTNGQMIAPFDWTDVAELDYEKAELHDAMIEEMKFWITEADIDGYRCDVAMEVPVEFWDRARDELDKVKPVFMLAEAEEPDHHRKAFDMSYAWELHHIMNNIANGEKNANDLEKYFKKNDTLFPADAYRMTFITNHDENSWNGTEYERMGEAVDVFAMLSFTLPGMPMLYTGQEAAFNRRLEFFDKDSVDWGDYSLAKFYQDLGDLRKKNPALWSGTSGGKMKRIKTNDQESIFAFFRRNDENTLAIIANLSPRRKTFKFKSRKYIQMKDYYSGDPFGIGNSEPMTLGPWEYKILIASQ